VLKHLDRVLFGKYNTLENIFNHACLLKQWYQTLQISSGIPVSSSGNW
jgi:hypothetical protein